ncbi:MAG TPA: methyltransferase [Nitriliruptorales bacterium]|nr:methyltransferase [Nitriliruptorales bacterium]
MVTVDHLSGSPVTFAGPNGQPTPDPFPPLHGVAMPVAQERQEQLVTVGTAPCAVDDVWSKLTDADQVAQWLAVCRGAWATPGQEVMLDFEDGEFFWCRTEVAQPPSGGRPGVLRYQWRWLGIGPATSVTWNLAPARDGTTMTVVEQAENPPSDWRSWNGMGWPGIIDQLVAHLRTGTTWRWPWRRMGPYIQIPLPAPAYQAWEAVTDPGAVKHWLQRIEGSLQPDDEMTLVMGDASGTIRLRVTRLVDTGQSFPSYLPRLEFELRRPSWSSALDGHLWIEPAGLNASLLQVFHQGWETLSIPDPVTERKLLTDFWVAAAGRAQRLLQPAGGMPVGPHGWSLGAPPDGAGVSVPADGPPSNGAAHRAPGPGVFTPGGDQAATMAFVGRVVDDLSRATASVLCALGSRLGLFEELAHEGPATASELAARTGLAERYLLEWARGLTSAGYLEHDATSDRFTLPAGAVAVLGSEGSPASLAGGYDLLLPLAQAVDVVADAFYTGEGVAHDRYPKELFSAMERMSATWLDTLLVQAWIPAVPGLADRLASGATIADVGCGGGRALVVLAQAFPRARLVGYELDAASLGRAKEMVHRSGVADRVDLEYADAADALPTGVDLVTMLDVLHDAPDPERLLRAAHRALVDRDGVLLVLEGRAADEPGGNRGPAATILYATSTLYCVPTALSDGGPGLGTLGLPPARLRECASAAGFSRCEEVPTANPFSALYALRP